MYLIAQITDLHLDHALETKLGKRTRSNFLAVLEDLRAKGVDEIILTGDLAERSAVKWLLLSLDSSGLRHSYVFGNHDLREEYPVSLQQGRHFFEREIAGIQCLFLDSGGEVIDDVQISWLRHRLEESEDRALIFVHHPILDCGTLFMDKKYPLKNRTRIKTILTESKREVHIFCGHYHMEHESSESNIYQHVCPSTYYQIKGDAYDLEEEDLDIGYRIIQINGEINSQIVRVRI